VGVELDDGVVRIRDPDDGAREAVASSEVLERGTGRGEASPFAAAALVADEAVGAREHRTALAAARSGPTILVLRIAPEARIADRLRRAGRRDSTRDQQQQHQTPRRRNVSGIGSLRRRRAITGMKKNPTPAIVPPPMQPYFGRIAPHKLLPSFGSRPSASAWVSMTPSPSLSTLSAVICASASVSEVRSSPTRPRSFMATPKGSRTVPVPPALVV